MTSQIVEKLQREIASGLGSECQVVYLLAGIRKIMEQEGLFDLHPYLLFHCNWALHSRLDRGLAQRILAYFDSAHNSLISSGELDTRTEVTKISKMEPFKDELSAFLTSQNLTNFVQEIDQWSEFQYHYARVIEDVPLMLRADNFANIRKVIISVQMANELVAGERFFKVSWNVFDRRGKPGEIFVINSFLER